MNAGPGVRFRLTRSRSLPAILVVFSVQACATEALREFASEEEAEIGRRVSDELDHRMVLIRDSALIAPLTDVGLALARYAPYPIAPYSFKMVDGETVNAFAVAGGSIYVYRGLVTASGSMSEVAAVLAHEIAHLSAGHASEKLYQYQRARLGIGPRMDRTGALFFANYSRAVEAEADSLAVELMIATGWDPEGLVLFFETLFELRDRQPSALEAPFLSHPLIEERLDSARRIIARIPPEQRARLAAPTVEHDRLLGGR